MATILSKSQITGLALCTKNLWIGMTRRRVLSGSAIAMFLGTISPNIICNIAAIAIAEIHEAVFDAPFGVPKFSKSDLINSPTEGSARIPRITLLKVIPS